MEKLGHGVYIPMDVNLLPPLYLIYAENPSDSGKVRVCSTLLVSELWMKCCFALLWFGLVCAFRMKNGVILGT